MNTTAKRHEPTTLADVAVQMAYCSALAYLKKHNLRSDEDALVSCVKAMCKIRLPEALRDAKAALDCGMKSAAEETFKAGMMLAGIEAAKEAGFPR